MKMFLAGQWVERSEVLEVRHPYDGSLVDTVPQATEEDVQTAVAAAEKGARQMRRLSAYDRYRILRRAAELMAERQTMLGELISREEGKVLREGHYEAQRATITMEVSAEEAKRLYGEVLPMDGAPGAERKFGFTLRVPCGIVVAITPFNFPLNLVCHKVGPALAAGNAVIVKPATDTPLSALKLVEILLEAGLPPLAVQCLTGRGPQVGHALCADPRVRKISFTGSAEVGEKICRVAGLKRVTMELGSNSPLIVLDDADLNKVTEATLVCGYTNAGQVCISAQRVIASQPVYEELVERLRESVSKLVAGDPFSPQTTVGPLIRSADAQRVEEWIQEAVGQGARLLCGGRRRQSIVEPAVLAEVRPDMRVYRDELFGPAVCLARASSFDEAIHLANDSRYGLSAAVFTQDIDRALAFAQRVESGNIHINWGPQWRADFMPYGGLKQSGMGKEGPRYAIEEMTELKTVVVHLSEPAE
ncbi:MAG: aldehyde dehydrogenase [Pirellulaceae bacterium]|nr:MAG: aldehyde dehydrogenase [Pirellulaceae bacterium]